MPTIEPAQLIAHLSIKILKGNANMNAVNVLTSRYLPLLIQIAMLLPKKLWSFIKSKKLDHTGVSTLNTRVVLTVTHRKRQTYLQAISHLSLLMIKKHISHPRPR